MAEPQIPEWLQTLSTLLGGGALVKVWDWFINRRRSAAEVRNLEAQAEHAFDDVVNQRIKNLLDSYERRIADLTDEVHALRAEVKELRKTLDQRPQQQQQPGFGQ